MVEGVNNNQNYNSTTVSGAVQHAETKTKINSLFAPNSKIKETTGRVNGDDNHLVKIGKDIDGKKIAVDGTTGEELIKTGSKEYMSRNDFDIYLRSTYGISSRELADKKIVAEMKHGKVVFTDIRRGVVLSDEVMEALRENHKNKTKLEFADFNDPENGVSELTAEINSRLENSKNIIMNYSPYQDQEFSINLVSKAREYLGQYRSSFKGEGFHNRWCADFVSHVARECGLEDFKHSSVSGILKWGKDNDAFHKEPQIGDVVIFKGRNKNGKRVSHTGIVYAIEDGKIKTIEGNTSSKVSEMEYFLNDSRITGYVSLT